MKQTWLLLLLLVLVFSSCKKDSNSGQNLVEFDLDGVHHSFTPNEAVIVIDTLSTGLFKAVQIAYNGGSFPFFTLAIGEDVSNPLDDCLITGDYAGPYYSLGCGDSTAGNCRNFNFIYGDNNGLWGSDYLYDSLTTLTLTSCSGSSPKIEGTFSCDLVDILGSNSTVKHITNGKIRGVTYVRQ